jgi:two-component system copper resistance phosphate regulon response regulator CusR
MRILVAEDERDLNEILCKKLRSEDYCVDGCFDGEEALDYLASVEYDAVILDIMMPKRSGLQVVEQLRRQGDHTPVLFLTARDSIDDRVTGLDAGADDYLVKPFAFDELLARLRVMTRKRGGERSNLFTIDDLTLDIRSKRVERGGVELKLSAKEYALLEYLIRNKGVVLSRIQIEENIWGFDYEGSSNIVDVYIRYLRRKIDKDHPVKLIHTIRGSGYVLKLP